VPELEGDLAALQKELARAGRYTGPISPPPALIPPTPFHSHHQTSLAVPQTPAVSQGVAARVQSTPYNAVAAARPASRINDSVRRAVQHKSLRQTHQRDLLSTIVDEEQHLQSPLAVVPRHDQQRSSQQVHLTPEELTSPLVPAIAASDDGTSPQFPKKLVFSPDDPTSSRSRLSAAQSISPLAQVIPHRTASASNSVAPNGSSVRHSASHATPVSSHAAPRIRPSPGMHASAGEGLLGDEELFSEERRALAEDEDEEEDEVVFGDAAQGSTQAARRHRSSAGVDPDAPTPPTRHTERKYDERAYASQRTPVTTQAQARPFASPSYHVEGQGLLDDDF
jgi:hypothetical protein